MPLAMEIGRRVFQGHTRERSMSADDGSGSLDAAVHALFGLLLAFV